MSDFSGSAARRTKYGFPSSVPLWVVEAYHAKVERIEELERILEQEVCPYEFDHMKRVYDAIPWEEIEEWLRAYNDERMTQIKDPSQILFDIIALREEDDG